MGWVRGGPALRSARGPLGPAGQFVFLEAQFAVQELSIVEPRWRVASGPRLIITPTSPAAAPAPGPDASPLAPWRRRDHGAIAPGGGDGHGIAGLVGVALDLTFAAVDGAALVAVQTGGAGAEVA